MSPPGRRTPAGGVKRPPTQTEDAEDFESITGTEMEPLAELNMRTRRVEKTTKSAQISLTNIREQFQRENGEIRDDIKQLQSKQDDLQASQNEIHGDVREIKGQLPIMGKLVELLEKRETNDHIVLKQTLDIQRKETEGENTQKLEKIKARNNLLLKWTAIVGPILAGLATAIVAGKIHC